MGREEQQWHVIVPIKALARAKSRLSLEPTQRRELVLAMALDTLDAIAAAKPVAAIWVVTADPDVIAATCRVAHRIVREQPSRGQEDTVNGAIALSEAIADAAEAVNTDAPTARLAVVMADLPALHSVDLEHLLASATGVPLATVPDADRSGTTVLLAEGFESLRHCFGPNSHQRHVAAGAVELAATPGIRRDVDTIDDLHAAVALGAGAQTTAALQRRLR